MIDRLMQAFSVVLAYFDDSEAVFVAAVGVAIGLLALSMLYLISGSMNAERKRVRMVVNEQGGDSAAARSARSGRRVESAIAPVRSLVLPSSNKEITAVRRRLVAAGRRHESAMAVFYVWKLGLALLFGIAALVATTFFPGLTGTKILMIAGGAAYFGMILPSHLLDKQVEKRKRAIINAFPEMLDLLVACSEAGLGLNAALQRVSREIDLSFPELGEELELVNAEMLAGIDRVHALRGLAERTDIPEISGFVSMLSQSVRFGTGIAETLRIYAEDFRDRRMQRAEEVAAKIGTKLLFPLVLCMFPSFFVVAVGPAAIAIIKAFSAT